VCCFCLLLLLLLLLQAELSELEGRAAAGRQELTALRAEVGAAVASISQQQANRPHVVYHSLSVGSAQPAVFGRSSDKCICSTCVCCEQQQLYYVAVALLMYCCKCSACSVSSVYAAAAAAAAAADAAATVLLLLPG
jgi:hypothetical protein